VSAPLLEVDQVVKRYPLRRDHFWQRKTLVPALRGVSLNLYRGKNLGIVGESGSGKSTLARLIMALERADEGRILFEGEELDQLPRRRLQNRRQHFQMVFQDPYGSLDPRHSIARIVAEPLMAQQQRRAADSIDAVIAALQSVGLRPTDRHKYPHEFSGGQRQRIALARALITRPKMIVADEPVSALDVSVQAQILNLLRDLQNDFGVTYLLISHDLAVIEYICEEVAVMFDGRIVEQAPAAALFHGAAHPYTRRLVQALPQLRPRHAFGPRTTDNAGARVTQSGLESNLGCPYARRCRHVAARCWRQNPPLIEVARGHYSACHFSAQVMAQSALDE
jgi:peptide/nickel transport system ATP-binding protein